MHVELTASYCTLKRDPGDTPLRVERAVVYAMRTLLNAQGYDFHSIDPSNVGLTACKLGLRDAKAKIILWHERYQIEDAREAFNKGEVTFQRVNEDWMPTFREVTDDEFFATLKADPRDIMPRIVNSTYPYISEWRNQKSVARELFGRSEGNPTRYFLVKED